MQPFYIRAVDNSLHKYVILYVGELSVVIVSVCKPVYGFV
jgi:hypothetical protein